MFTLSAMTSRETFTSTASDLGTKSNALNAGSAAVIAALSARHAAVGQCRFEDPRLAVQTSWFISAAR